MSNTLLGDHRVMLAAFSLANMCVEQKDTYKAIVFDIHDYMLLVLGKGIELPEALTDITPAHIDKAEAHQTLVTQFAEALSDAFSTDAAMDIANIQLVEIGGCEIAGVEGTYWQVAVAPEPVLRLDL